jgi:energy-coupling factor transporter transmembrane protein EcfT
MSKALRILKYFLIIILIAFVSGCASTKHSSSYRKKMKGSKVHTSQLGRNKFFFSSGYQKKLFKSYKKKKY